MNRFSPLTIEFWRDVKEGMMLAFFMLCALICIASLVAWAVWFIQNFVIGMIILLCLLTIIFVLSLLGRLKSHFLE